MALEILSGLTLLFCVFTCLPLSNSEKWWIRGWDFPRLQLAVLLVLLLVAQGVWLELSRPWSWLLVAVTLGCLGYQLWWILPYTRLWKQEVLDTTGGSGVPLRVLAANVLTPNKNAQGLIDLISEHEPDVFVTLETDARWEEQLDALLPRYPHKVACPLDNLYGMHVYSRLPLRDAEISFLVEDDIPSIHAEVILSTGVGVRVHFLHPAPPSPTENEESIQRDVELLMVAKSLQKWRGPVVVTGDLNDVAWSRTTRLFRRISGLLDPRVGRGMFNTYHAEHWFLRWPLDHLFHSEHFTLLGMKRLAYFGSDHFPVLIELSYQGAHLDQEGLAPPDSGDRAQVQEKLREEQADPSDVPTPGDG